MTKKPTPSSVTHRKLNNILAVATIGFGVYLLVSPFMPSLDFWLQKRSGFEVPAFAADVSSAETIPSDNRLVIPAIGINEHIIDSNNPNAVNDGVLRQPWTSMPSKGSNTVLVGHRYSYSLAVKFPFYNLDKVAVGDDVVIAWEGVVYRYKVTEVKVVEPSEISVEDPTSDAKLTLYTCTPLWAANKRLVVVAKLVEPSP